MNLKLVIVTLFLVVSISPTQARERRQKREVLQPQEQKRNFQKSHNQREITKGIKREMGKRFKHERKFSQKQKDSRKRFRHDNQKKRESFRGHHRFSKFKKFLELRKKMRKHHMKKEHARMEGHEGRERHKQREEGFERMQRLQKDLGETPVVEMPQSNQTDKKTGLDRAQEVAKGKGIDRAVANQSKKVN